VKIKSVNKILQTDCQHHRGDTDTQLPTNSIQQQW